MTASCRVCGRQVEVSDSGQAMPCVCILRPLDAFLADCVADCVGPAAPEPEPEAWRCEGCGETFDGPRTSHGRAAHAPCPIVRLGAPEEPER